MAKVLGIGGVFFKSPDPPKLFEWYQKWLGIQVEGDWGATFAPDQMPPGGYTVWSVFPADTTYFEPSSQKFMINLVVDDIEGAIRQIKQGGAQQVDEIQSTEYGRFGWFIDPDGNKVELWQPAPIRPPG